MQTRSPFCVDVKANARVGDEICDENNSTKPETEKVRYSLLWVRYWVMHVTKLMTSSTTFQECLTVDCDAEWFTGDWESCSASCGSAGEQYRVVYCHQVR